MGIVIRRRRPATPGPPVEVVTPRTNQAMITPAENGFASISPRGTYGFEIAVSRDRKQFLLRAEDPHGRRVHDAAEQFAVAYAQAGLRLVDPAADPVRMRPGEQSLSCAFRLARPEYLPMRTFTDLEVDDTRSAQADPVLGLLGAMGGLPEGWRALSQLSCAPAPRGWGAGYQHLARERHPQPDAENGSGLGGVLVLLVLVAGGLGAVRVYDWYRAGEWLAVTVALTGIVLTLPLLILLARRLLRREPPPDPQLVREKIDRPGHLAGLRVTVFAPGDVPPEEVRGRLQRIADAYGVYNHGNGNALVPWVVTGRTSDLARLASIPPMGVLNTRELAGLWHLPQAESDVALVERTAARAVLPLPEHVSGPCRIGVSRKQDRTVEVGLPEEVLSRHGLLVAKARRGKSSLLLSLARHMMLRRQALFVFDPHSDLARAVLGIVPPELLGSVVYLDVSNTERPFGLNLLDVQLWRDQDKAVSSTLKIFKQQFGAAWGGRMEDVFGHALHTLYEANESLCAESPHGRNEQYTILDVSELLGVPAFQESVLKRVRNPTILRWWRGYFANLNANQQKEFVNPVQTKVQAYARMRHARLIVGQPRSTIDPHGLLRNGSVVVVNTAKGEVGEDTAGLVGAALINLLSQLVAQQGARPEQERSRATLVVDEFHSMPGADYEYVLSELPKFGANMWLATQSLGRLAALDRASGRGLVSTVFSTVDQLFAFHTSAEDARYLVPELGEGLREADLGELSSYHCYARLTLGGRRQPAFSVELDPPPVPDPERTRALASESYGFYGRTREAVENDLRSAYARIDEACKAKKEAKRSEASGGEPNQGIDRDKAAQGTSRRGRSKNGGSRSRASQVASSVGVVAEPADVDETWTDEEGESDGW